MKLFLSLLLVLLQVFTPFAYSGTKTLVKADILEGNVAEVDILGSSGHFEKNALNWAAYDDAAADPVDATGGTSTTTCARTATTPIDGDGSLLMTKAGGVSYQGEGCALTFTVPANLSGEPLQISFEYKIDSGTYADDAVELWLYNSTGTTLIQPAPTLLKNHLLNRQTYRAEFQPTYSTSAQTFRLALHIGGSDATAYALKLDNFRVYKGKKSYGSPITDWISYTPTWTKSLGTQPSIGNGTLTGQYRRVGSDMEVIIKLTAGSTSTYGDNTGIYRFSYPSGFTLLSSLSGETIVGQWGGLDSGTNRYSGNVRTSSTYVETISLAETGTYPTANTELNGTVPWAMATNDVITVVFKVPITGWSSSVVMSSDADTRVISLTAFRDTSPLTVTAATPLEVILNKIETSGDTHGAFSTANGRFTAQAPGWYRFSANALFTMGATAASNIELYVKKNGGATPLYGYYFLDSLTNSKNYTIPISDKVYLNAGDYISLWAACATQNVTLQSNASSHVTSMSIERISGPAQIAASETVAALYTGAPPTGTIDTTLNNIITFGTKVKDSTGSYSSGSYTIPVSGVYSIGASVDTNHSSITAAQYVGLAIAIDGTARYARYSYAQTTNVNVFAQVDVNSVPLLAGQVVTVRVQSTGTTPSFNASATVNNFYITRTGNY